jgi:hypothetical protein
MSQPPTYQPHRSPRAPSPSRAPLGDSSVYQTLQSLPPTERRGRGASRSPSPDRGGYRPPYHNPAYIKQYVVGDPATQFSLLNYSQWSFLLTGPEYLRLQAVDDNVIARGGMHGKYGHNFSDPSGSKIHGYIYKTNQMDTVKAAVEEANRALLNPATAAYYIRNTRKATLPLQSESTPQTQDVLYRNVPVPRVGQFVEVSTSGGPVTYRIISVKQNAPIDYFVAEARVDNGSGTVQATQSEFVLAGGVFQTFGSSPYPVRLL